MNDRLNIILQIDAGLNDNQRRKLTSLGYHPTYNLHEINMNDWRKVTKNKKLTELLKELKRMSIKLVA